MVILWKRECRERSKGLGQVTGRTDLSNIDDDKEFRRFASILFSAITDNMNGGLEFESNIKGQIVTKLVPQTANEMFSIDHNLNKTDVNFIVINKTASTDIYRTSGTANTKNKIYLAASVGNVQVTLLLF